MAFMGRGGIPSFNDSMGSTQGNNDIGRHEHYRGYWHFRRYYYIPLDNTYVIMQMIVTFIILIIGVVPDFGRKNR